MGKRWLVLTMIVLCAGTYGWEPAAVSAASLGPAAFPAEAAACESLAALALPTVTVTVAQAVPAGDFALPGSTQHFPNLPAFCRVAATLRPSRDSDIKIEVWMPSSHWNGKFEGVGNGGWAGTIAYAALAAGVSSGYAVASTDTGHTGGNASFALGHPEKYIDMGYRAVHEMSVQGKAIAARFYGNSPTSALWNGCSQGGRQGITEAERYPADYDAVIAGAPSIYQMHLNGARVAINLMAHRSANSDIPPAKYPLVHNAVLEACDALDGVKDGVLEDPTTCRFDPGALLCTSGDAVSCLTAAQVDTARAIYAPIRNPATGAELSVPLLVPGTELGWATLTGPEPLDIPVSGFKYVVFKDPNWDWHTFNTATDVARGNAADNGVIDKTDPNLAPFFGRGGKLLMYHGWADPQVAPLNSVKYFGDVEKTVGHAAVGTSIQLYMVPGMGHCSGGVGPNTFDKVAAMDRWIATGRAPDTIVASHSANGRVDRTRPLCPYGQVAKWNGNGSTDDAASFTCGTR